MNQPRKKLSDILRQTSDRERLSSLWKTTAAAADFAPLPPGEYTFRTLSGELFTSKTKGTPGYKLTLEVTEGEHEGRRCWHDLWLTEDALPMTKRDLAKIGVTDLAQLEQPLPAGILIRGRLARHRDDDGNESNKLKRFECVGVEKGDAFEPPADDAGQSDAGEPNTSFPFGVNAPASGDSAAPVPSPNGKPPADANAAAQPSTNGEPPAGSDGTTAKPKRKRKKTDASAPGAVVPPPIENAGQADAKPLQTNGTPAGELFPSDAANGGADANQQANDFLARERGGRP